MLNPLFELFRGACYSGNMRRAFSEKKRIRALYANETNYVHVVAIRGKVTRGGERGVRNDAFLTKEQNTRS